MAWYLAGRGLTFSQYRQPDIAPTKGKSQQHNLPLYCLWPECAAPLPIQQCCTNVSTCIECEERKSYLLLGG
jgi:hypothetical protein